MFDKLIKTVLGDPRERNFKRVKPIIQRIRHFEEEYNKLTDEELAGKTV